MIVIIETARSNNLQPSDIFRMIIGNVENVPECSSELKQICAEIYNLTNNYSISIDNKYMWIIEKESKELRDYLIEKLITNYKLGNIGHFDVV